MRVKAGDVVVDKQFGQCKVVMARATVVFGPNVILEDRAGRLIHLSWREANGLQLDPDLTAIEVLKNAGRLGM